MTNVSALRVKTSTNDYSGTKATTTRGKADIHLRRSTCCSKSLSYAWCISHHVMGLSMMEDFD